MEIKILNSGVAVPCIGFGTYKIAPAEAYRCVREALDLGYRHIDTAAFYGNEEQVGKAVRESGISREKIFVTTKLWNDSHGRERTLKAFGESMKRLDIGYIDLYLIHWPKENNIETYLAMEELYGRKEARNIGVSNFNVRHLSELLPAVSVTPAVNQIEFHPLLQQPELFGYCERSGISVEAWSPLGRGRLLDNPAIKKLAEKYGCTTAQIILRWNLQRGIITIPKSTHRQRMEENLNVSGFALSSGDVETVNRMDEGKRFGPDPETVDF